MKYFLVIAVVVGLLTTAEYVHADTLNQGENFFISSQYDAFAQTDINSTLRYISDHAYWYIEDDAWATRTSIQRDQLLSDVGGIADEFDDRIYPIETEFFGAAPSPGIDGDERITIVLTPLVSNVGGYFDTTNQYTVTDSRTSNEREMFYLNINQLSDARRLNSFLAHEFQHLITFQQKDILRNVQDDIWLNELRSEYAVDLLGYNNPFSGANLERRAIALVREPEDSLTEWKNEFADYGAIAIFGQYLAERFSPRIIADTLKSNRAGILSIDDALSLNGIVRTAEEIFGDWLVANALNDRSIGQSYGYQNEGLRDLSIVPTYTVNNLTADEVTQFDVSLRDWEGRWFDFISLVPDAEGNNQLDVTFVSSSLASFVVKYVVFGTDGITTVHTFKPNVSQNTLNIPDIGTEINRILLVTYKKDKLAGFGSNEPTIPFTILAERGPVTSTSLPIDDPSASVTPEQFGLNEGDFIRARGDNDVFIINSFGHKRLVLSPEICLQYEHLGARGCFGAVNVVAPKVRDAFKTSYYFTNGETNNGIIYELEITGEDSGILRIVSSAPLNEEVFLFNTREQGSYDTE